LDGAHDGQQERDGHGLRFTATWPAGSR
jgi:hypothetical protein